MAREGFRIPDVHAFPVRFMAESLAIRLILNNPNLLNRGHELSENGEKGHLRGFEQNTSTRVLPVDLHVTGIPSTRIPAHQAVAMSVPPETSSTTHFESIRSSLSEGFASGVLSLPVLPEIARKVMATANDPDATVTDLSDLIHQDQALAANVLRFANTAAYNTGEVIMSLSQAVMRLGVSMVSGIAIAACLEGDGFATPGYDPYRRRLMAHALVSGGFARLLGRKKRLDVEVLFLCALLHTVGKPVVLRLISDLEGGSNTSLSEAEVDALIKEFHHMAASDVTLAWNLPEHVQVAAIYHEDPEQAPGYFTETKLTALSGKLASWVEAGEAAEDTETVGRWPEWEEFDFAPSDVDAVIEHADELRQSAASMLA